jgi:SAM-dependent methyltransferase
MTYTHGHHESVLRSHKWRTVDNSAAYLAPRLTHGISVLDLGCGPGTITADIGRRVAPGRVLGIDASANVIEEARRAAGGGPNVEFSVGDLYALTIDEDTFDVVHAHQVLQHLADPIGALCEMKRVCKPGGLVAARDGDYGAFRWYPDEPAIDRWLALYRDVARRNAGEPDAGRFLLAWAHGAPGCVGVVLRYARRPRVVGRVVGRPHDRFRDRPSSRHRRPRDRERAARDRRRMASLGHAPGCLVRRPPRRDPLPRLAFP